MKQFSDLVSSIGFGGNTPEVAGVDPYFERKNSFSIVDQVTGPMLENTYPDEAEAVAVEETMPDAMPDVIVEPVRPAEEGAIDIEAARQNVQRRMLDIELEQAA